MYRIKTIPRIVPRAGIPLILVIAVLPSFAQARRQGPPPRNAAREEGTQGPMGPNQQGNRRQLGPGAQPNAPDRAGMGQDLMRRVFDRLDLNNEQKLQIRRIRQETQREIQSARMQVRDTRKALEDALYGDNFDPAVVEAKMKEAAQADANQLRVETQGQARVRQVLTPEQVRQFRELRDFVRSLGEPNPGGPQGPNNPRRVPDILR